MCKYIHIFIPVGSFSPPPKDLLLSFYVCRAWVSPRFVKNMHLHLSCRERVERISNFTSAKTSGRASLYYEDSSGDRVHLLTHVVLSGIVCKYECLKFIFIVCLSSYSLLIVRMRQNKLGRTPSRWNALFLKDGRKSCERADHDCRVSKYSGHGTGLSTNGWKYLPCSPISACWTSRLQVGFAQWCTNIQNSHGVFEHYSTGKTQKAILHLFRIVIVWSFCWHVSTRRQQVKIWNGPSPSPSQTGVWWNMSSVLV